MGWKRDLIAKLEQEAEEYRTYILALNDKQEWLTQDRDSWKLKYNDLLARSTETRPRDKLLLQDALHIASNQMADAAMKFAENLKP